MAQRAQRKPAASAKQLKRPAAVKKRPAMVMKVMKVMKARESLEARQLRRLTMVKGLRDFKAAVKLCQRTVPGSINRLPALHGLFLRDLVGSEWDCGGVTKVTHSKQKLRKLEILLDAGLDADAPGLLWSSVWGSLPCLKLLLQRGADPLGDFARNPRETCPFTGAAEETGKVPQLKVLKAALARHPKYAHRAEAEWQNAIERIHENLLEMSGRRHYGQEKKWLRDAILQHVDKRYAVSP